MEAALIETPYPKDDKGRFLSGNIGGGRKVGSRNKLGEAFLDDLFADWQGHGIQAIAECRETNPAAYLKVIASLLPKDINVRSDVTLLEAILVAIRDRSAGNGVRELTHEPGELRNGHPEGAP